ncbi:complex I subunit 5 family protein [Psychromonas sp.]|uniref:complex I subunit 5 family protein n=1 Tax=Psychromonas sp. TaxID=1884585 RepID=UPI003564C212
MALILLPLAGGIACFLWQTVTTIVGLIILSAVVISVAGLAWQMMESGVYRHAVGGWNAPLGIDLYADGLSLLMLTVTALVGLCISIYSTGYFEPKRSARFWPLWLFLLAALNALFLSADIFNLYVTLELMGLAAVALTALSGDKDALTGAMRYLLATLLGSLAYLFGVGLLYHGFGSIDIAILAQRVESIPITWAAFGLMSTGLILKSALFPFHFWLPPAHASAPAPVSAVLSALVVKASFYLLLRLWLEIFKPLGAEGVESLLGLLGAIAVLWGSLLALMQTRLKLLIAYSTVAQIGYLFIAFSLAASNSVTAWYAAAYLTLSHALAKAAMFLSAGNLLHFAGQDRIADLDRAVQRLPLSVTAFALAGVSIMGIPPSGGFIGKWLLLEAAIQQSRWGMVAIILLGGLLAAGYIFKVLGHAFTQVTVAPDSPIPSALMQWTALLLACAAILLGFLAPQVLSLLVIGDPFSTREVTL